jgi:hypothetical protein
MVELWGTHLTIVTANECIPITICHNSINVFFCLFKSNVHVPIKARQYTWHTDIRMSFYPGLKALQGEHTTVVDPRRKANYDTLTNDIF